LAPAQRPADPTRCLPAGPLPDLSRAPPGPGRPPLDRPGPPPARSRSITTS